MEKSFDNLGIVMTIGIKNNGSIVKFHHVRESTMIPFGSEQKHSGGFGH